MPLTGNPKNDISEMAHSPNHRKRVRKYGKKKAHEIEVAAAMHAKDERGKRKSKRAGSRKTSRKKKRGSKRKTR